MNVVTFTNFRSGRVSLAAAKRILNRNGNAYSDEEVKKIADYLYALAELAVEHAENQNRKNADRCEQNDSLPMKHAPKHDGCRIPKSEYPAFD